MGRLSSVNLSCVCVLSALRLYFACVYVFVCFLGGCVQISPSVGCFVLVPSKVSFPYPWEGTFAEPLVLYLFFSLSLPLSLSVITLRFILILILSRRVTRRFRIANHMVMDSCCRGGIVDTRGGCSRALFVPPKSPTALWRFRASTSNSLSGRSRLHARTHMPYIYDTYAQQDIRECGDDHLQPPKRQYPNPKALSLLRISI